MVWWDAVEQRQSRWQNHKNAIEKGDRGLDSSMWLKTEPDTSVCDKNSFRIHWVCESVTKYHCKKTRSGRLHYSSYEIVNFCMRSLKQNTFQYASWMLKWSQIFGCFPDFWSLELSEMHVACSPDYDPSFWLEFMLPALASKPACHNSYWVSQFQPNVKDLFAGWWGITKNQCHHEKHTWIRKKSESWERNIQKKRGHNEGEINCAWK